MLLPPRADPWRAARQWIASPTTVLVGTTLAGIFVLGWFSVLTRPAEAVAAVWWPASGLALGLAIRVPRKYLWLVSAAVGAVLLVVFLALYSSPLLSLAAAIGAGMEVAVGAMILRAGGVDSPGLETYSDLGMLLLAVVTAATVYGLTIAAAALAAGDVQTAIAQLFSAGPRRAAGMLMVAPLFMRLPPPILRVRRAHVVLQILVALVVSVLVFMVNEDWPISFLVILPPVWGALTLGPRLVLIEMLGIATIASIGSANGAGPFSFPRFGPTLGGTLLQAFELAMVAIVLVICITFQRERAASAQLGASELVFRSSFENSLAGMLVVADEPGGLVVQRHNAAAEGLLPALAGGERQLSRLLGPQAAAEVGNVLLPGRTDRQGLEVETADGRHFQVGAVPLDLHSGSATLAVQFLDISAAVQARRRTAEELERARDVQRALSPAELPSRPGWSHGAAAVPARDVGGDFYDLRIEGRQAVVLLGDVMGKGIGSGLLAAATRTALRSASPASRPVDALADSVRIIDVELARSDAFVTLGYATIDLQTGETRLVDAGHGLSFVLRHAGGGVERLAGDDLPIGLGTEWMEQRFVLAPGDSLLMVSDGVLEGWGGSVEHLLAAVSQLRSATGAPQAFTHALCRGADEFAEPADDATAVIIHRDLPKDGEPR